MDYLKKSIFSSFSSI